MKSTTNAPHPGAGWARVAVVCTLLLALLLLGRATRAQNAPPTFAGASSGNNFQPTSGSSVARATATDPATGNVYVTGSFTGQVTFGSTRLVSAGSSDVFVAKWDAAALAWTSAVSGGGTGADIGYGIAVSSAGGVASVYVTGSYNGSATLAGTALTAAGGSDVFVAKYTDSGTGLTSTNGGAVSGGGTGADVGQGIAVGSAGGGASVYVTGSFAGSATLAGTALTSAGSSDVFVAKYTDSGTGLSTTDGGAVGGGGVGFDTGNGIAVGSAGGVASVYVTGYYNGSATLTGTALTSSGGIDVFVAKYTDGGAGLSTASGGAVGGGGSSTDVGQGIAVSSAGGVASVYVTGYYVGSATLAGTTLTAAGGSDVFVAKYTDPGTGLMSTNGGAVGGGSTNADQGNGIAVSSAGGVASVYVTGSYNGSATLAGTALTATGGNDIFVAKYTDSGTGLSTTNGGAASGGGGGTDQGNGVALAGSTVYVGAQVGSVVAGFGSSPVRRAPGSSAVLARLDAGTLGYQGIEGPLQGGSSYTQAMATDPATGNVYVTGYFTGTVAFGSTRLVSTGISDVFVAKWDAAAQAWTSAVSGGGGTGSDIGYGIAVSSAGGVASVYVTGYYQGSATLAGTALTSAGGTDVFVAKYTDPGTGLTTTNGGAVSGGGTGADQGLSVAVSSAGGGASVYVTGYYNGSATIGGTALTSVGNSDAFVAKYTDPGTGLTNGGAVSGGGTNADQGNGIAVSSAGGVATVYVTGYYTSRAPIAGTTLTSAGSSTDVFVAKYTDPGTGLSTTDGGAVSGGGTSTDVGVGVAVGSAGGVASVYVTGYYNGSATLAGTALTAAGGTDVFVAKYTDSGTGLSTTSGGAVSGGGGGGDIGYGVAVGSAGSVASVYVTGSYQSSATIAGTALTAAGSSQDVFVAKYTDPGTGLTSTDGGAVGGGGTGTDQGNAVAIAGRQVYVGGFTTPSATFGSTTLANPAGGNTNVLARLTDNTLTPLPVQLVQFAAAPAGSAAVRLTWATASELNSARFEVERSPDGVTFARIGTVAAAGSSTTRRAYTYHDAAAPAGPSYYRLRQVDHDGSSAYSPVRAVALGGASLALYPNPAPDGAATLTGTAPGQVVRVFDALGRLAATTTADATGTATLSGLAPGLYLVRVGAATVRLAVGQAR